MTPFSNFNPDARDECLESLASAWEPIRRQSVCQWVENNVELPTGAMTGKVDLSNTPYAREMLECYGDKSIRHLVMVMGTQMAKTTILSCGMLYRIARDPEDAMWVFGNADQARDFNKERFMPFVNFCRAVYDLVPKGVKGTPDRNLWGFRNQHYLSMVLNFVGAGSTTQLSSRPRGFIQMDECDKYYDEIKFDAGTIQLAEERQKTFHFPLAVKASSPTLAERMIWQEYLKTDMRQFWLPCPRCGEFILLKFRAKSDQHGDCGLRWWHNHEDEAKTDGQWDMKKVRAMAHYKCQCCGGMIHSHERDTMLTDGQWRPQNLRAESGRRGYQINSMHSILSEETSLGAIAVKFLIAKGIRSELQNFINGWLAEPFDEAAMYDFKEVKLEIVSNEEMPADSVNLMAIDVQEIGYWVLVRKFARPSPARPHGESWLLYAGFVQTLDECSDLQKEYEVSGENITMDMARRPNAVAKIIIEKNWRGVWGTDTKSFYHPTQNGTRIERPFSVVQFRDPGLGTAWENRSLKRAMYVKFSKGSMLDVVASLRYAEPSIWHCSVNVHPDYSRHMNSRVKMQKKNKQTGRVEWVWHELHQQNHLSDCESHVTVRALHLGLLVLPDETSAANVA